MYKRQDKDWAFAEQQFGKGVHPADLVGNTPELVQNEIQTGIREMCIRDRHCGTQPCGTSVLRRFYSTFPSKVQSARMSFITLSKVSGVMDCAPSQSASGGLG